MVASRHSKLFGAPLLSPNLPATPGRDATFIRAGLELRPLAGPDIPLSTEQAEAFEARYLPWQAQYNGSVPEFIVWEFLTIDKKQEPNVDFAFQHPLFGGRTRFGGFILDFFLGMRREGWRIQGERFHLDKPQDRARDILMKAQLEGLGIRIIDLWESDLLTRKLFVLNTAWEQGVSVQSRAPV